MPKKRSFDFVVPGTPEQVSERLNAETRYRSFPHQTSILGTGGLGGRVSPKRFSVSDDPSTFFRRILPVATGEFVLEGDNATRVRGSIGLPGWITWLYRLAFVIFVGMSLMIGGIVVTQGVGPALLNLAGWSTFLLAMLGVIGAQVYSADQAVDPLADRLGATLSANGTLVQTTEAQRSARPGRIAE